MAKAETRHTENPTGQSKDLGIHLDYQDLAELQLRRRLMIMQYKSKPPKGAMSFPRYKVAEDPSLGELIKTLEEAGRARVDVKLPKTPCISPNEAGNIIVYPSADASVEATLNEIDLAAMTPVLDMYAKGVIPIRSVSLLPNSSTSKPKGMIVEIDQRVDKWWRTLPKLGWSLGRGIGVTQLNMTTDEFIDRSDELLALTLHAGRTLAPGELKYVQYGYDDQGLMYMIMAGGPSYEESLAASEALSGSTKVRAAQGILESHAQYSQSKRIAMSRFIAEITGIEMGDLVVDAAYIGADTDQGIVFSGATTGSNGIKPFTVGASDIILHTFQPDEVTPMGTKPHGILSCPPVVPVGFQLPPLSSTPPSLFNQATIDEYISSLPPVSQVHVLGLGYHSDMKDQKPRRPR